MDSAQDIEVEGVNSWVADDHDDRSLTIASNCSLTSGAATIGRAFPQEIENVMVEHLTRMELTDDRFLRATPANRLIQCSGRGIRRTTAPNFAHSRPVRKIDKFISHSWQASPLLKVLTLQMFFNWKAAVFAANLSALLGMILFSFGFLPGFTKAPRWGTEPIVLGTWSLAFGLLSFLLVWFLRAPREMLFFDWLCINQEDQLEKMEVVVNIGACLKHSTDLVVVFDETFCGRLWCLFEMAAFLKTHEDGAILVQPMSLTIFFVVRVLTTSLLQFSSLVLPYDSILTIPVLVFGICFYGWLAATLILRYDKEVDLMRRQLEAFTFEEATCSCCSMNHVNPTNPDVPTPCDREIIRKCVERWFGSVESFEQLVRTQVKDALNVKFGGRFCSCPLVIASNLSTLWAMMDYAAARFRQQDISAGFGLTALGLGVFAGTP